MFIEGHGFTGGWGGGEKEKEILAFGKGNDLHCIFVIGWIMAPREVHSLIPKTSEYVTLPRRRGFTDLIRLRILEVLLWRR